MKKTFYFIGYLLFGLLASPSGAFAAVTPFDVDAIDPLTHAPAACVADGSMVNTDDAKRQAAQCVFLWRILHSSAPVVNPASGAVEFYGGEGIAVDLREVDGVALSTGVGVPVDFQGIDGSSVSIQGIPVLSGLEKTPEVAVLFGGFCALVLWGGIRAGLE